MHPDGNLIWRQRAQTQMERGDLAGALGSLRHALSADPTDAGLHALLAVVLTRQRRLHAARHEAREALLLDPELPWAHHAAAVCAIARKELKEAGGHLRRLLELEPEDAGNHLLLAQLQALDGQRARVRETLERARALEPGSLDVQVALGDDACDRGELHQAEALARAVLQQAPENVHGLVLMGRVRLRRGDVAAAREHAHWALRADATNEAALGLLADVKARQNPLIGVWWRYATWMQQLESTRAILLLLGAFGVYRFSAMAAVDLGWQFGDLITYGWLAICAYTWFAPELYRRMVARELEQVNLRPDF